MSESEMPIQTQEPSGPAGYERGERIPGAGALGVGLFIASLSMLFAASVIGYFVVRLRADAWPPPGMPGLPKGLWFSTLVLIVSSFTIHTALRGARSNAQGMLKLGMLLTVALGIVFLISQVLSWSALYRAEVTMKTNLYGFTFYMLTGLHGAHVIGGLIPLCVVTVKSFLGRYSSEYHPGVQYCAMYWHFLDAVWLIMFLMMVVFS